MQIPLSNGIKHPKCAVCDVSMWLAHVEPDKPDQRQVYV